ncbi:FAD-dependent monooxygenase [Nonomuraea diastatica]|uniref:FAD-binding domain-containing protein n=1 Tax=Nonomuraea diastatica TaxID=1848329 RepID=A0A4R4WEF2_9ACTN|nr:FAD-dependent monooxygenase [Nonomuraea diastatica]TDD17232.1 hypothetical protein E1294_28345 [Nonomuraea diastatica]
MPEPSVLVVGAGPTGLTVAAELALAGVSCRVLEQRAETSDLTRAFGVSARTMELLDLRGLADDLLAQALPITGMRFRLGTTAFSADFRHRESRFPVMANVAQQRTERLLAAHAAKLGVEIVRGAEIIALRQNDTGVEVEVTSPAGTRTERADYLIGCDGAHSTVRRLLGVGFAGASYDTSILLADLKLRELGSQDVLSRTYVDRDGLAVFGSFQDGWTRAVIWDRQQAHLPVGQPVRAEEVRGALRRIAGSDLGMGQMRWSTRFRSERRLARRYQVGRVMLAGDAAHVFSPFLGLGMNTGIQDAMNLGWKLAAQVNGWASPWLLGSYQQERFPIGRQLVHLTDLLQHTLVTPPAVLRPLRSLVWPLVLGHSRSRATLQRQVAGLAVAYAPAARQRAHRWVGQRVPDLAVGGSRLFAALRSGRFVLLDRTGEVAATARDRWTDRLDALHVPDPWPAGWPAVLLIRPDGYVAWAAQEPLSASQLPHAHQVLQDWCGRPATSGRPR